MADKNQEPTAEELAAQAAADKEAADQEAAAKAQVQADADREAAQAAADQKKADQEATAKAIAEAEAADQAAKDAHAKAAAVRADPKASDERNHRWALFLIEARKVHPSRFDAQKANGEFDTIPDSFI